MANTLFARVLHGLSLSSQSRPTSPRSNNTVHHTKKHSSPSKRQLSLTRLKSILSLTMKPQPPVSVVIYDVPKWLDQKSIEDRLKGIQTLIRVRYMKQSRSTLVYDLILDFDPGTDAFHSLQISRLEPRIVLNHIELTVSPFVRAHVSEDIEVISELKVSSPLPNAQHDQTHRHDLEFTDFSTGQGECYICRCELDGPFSTPCWSCKNPECYNCIRTHFNTALQDFQCFPAICCGVALHPDVAKGILKDTEHAKYKARMEVWLAKQPLYCPIPTCSAFIPLRLVQQSHGTETRCHQCQTKICTLCKQGAHTGQPCQEDKGHHERTQLLQKFGYKQCPKCGTAIAKMYGCFHVQCTCGANWCWSCRRRIDACSSSPCNEAQGGMDDVDHQTHHDQESDIDDDSIGELDVPSAGEQQENENDDDDAEVEKISIEGVHPSRAEPIQQPISDWAYEYFHTPPRSPPVVGPYLGADDGFWQSLMASNANDRNDAAQVGTHDSISNENQHGVLADEQPRTQDRREDDTSTAMGAGTSVTDSKNVNLDDPALGIWENSAMDFGDDPGEEESPDVWSCVHVFEAATHNKVPRHWMTPSVPDWWERDVSQREIECMICWKPTKVALKKTEIDDMDEGEDKRKVMKDWRFTRRCTNCGIFVCRRCKNDLVRDD